MPKKDHTEEQIVGGVATSGSRSTGSRGLSQGRDQRGDLLSVEAAVLGSGRELRPRTGD